jgi:hypothetical protein
MAHQNDDVTMIISKAEERVEKPMEIEASKKLPIENETIEEKKCELKEDVELQLGRPEINLNEDMHENQGEGGSEVAYT